MTAAVTAERAFRRAAALVARSHGLPMDEVLAPRGRAARGQRLVAAYLAVVGLGQPIKRVAAAAGLNPRGISRALARIEDQRDIPAVDARLDHLEARLCGN